MHVLRIGGSVDDAPDQVMDTLLQHVDDYTSSSEQEEYFFGTRKLTEMKPL